MISLWVDDVREPPQGWIWAKTADEAIQYLTEQQVEMVSLDHDLGDNSVPEKDGCTVACFIERRVDADPTYIPPQITVHSANPVGRSRIRACIYSIGELMAWRKTQSGE